MTVNSGRVGAMVGHRAGTVFKSGFLDHVLGSLRLLLRNLEKTLEGQVHRLREEAFGNSYRR